MIQAKVKDPEYTEVNSAFSAEPWENWRCPEKGRTTALGTLELSLPIPTEMIL